ncbi:hypothetical protein SAMN04488563_5259 [Jiangella alkaliphila]|uniref:YjbR protein n=1 Tax=Jiangella alkaliphila TaxID=419479 RepID=A0A1H2L7B4_9ACTN|nr:hypothetical protein SAMN04488563_5259 [Jiangella alkaliphila]
MVDRTAGALYEDIEDRLLADRGVERSTMMGFPCLRLRGRFFASFDAQADALVIKLPRQRVRELIGEGLGEPFAPAGRVFREWVSLPIASVDAWDQLADEARRFARLHESAS